jgi:hypothetical protein
LINTTDHNSQERPAGAYPAREDWKMKRDEIIKSVKGSAIIIRNVPLSVRRDLKSKCALAGRSMQDVVLGLIMQYISK